LNPTTDPEPPLRSGRRRLFRWVIGTGLIWFLVAYAVAPMIWEGYARIDPKLDDNPRVTQTDDRHPGDPLNVELIGTSLQLEALMKAAGLYTAAALGIVSDLEIAADTVFSRPDETAPVSSLYLFGRKEDFAFEQSRGDNPRHRHHVRFCQTNDLSDGRGKGVRTLCFVGWLKWASFSGVRVLVASIRGPDDGRSTPPNSLDRTDFRARPTRPAVRCVRRTGRERGYGHHPGLGNS